jgi:uncharacterized membrane protein YdbT with pleckstrin-like domain
MCREPMRVGPSLVGQQIDCPHCHRAVRIEAPVAELVEDGTLDKRDHRTVKRVSSPMDSEEVLKIVHPVMFRAHPVWFLLFSACVLLGIVIAVGSEWLAFPWGLMWGFVLGGATVLVGAVGLFLWWIKTRMLTLEITSKRTRSIRGLFAKSTSEVQHDDVRNIQIAQSSYGRLVGVGTLAVSSSGQDDLEIVAKGIPAPNEIAELIRDRQ